MHSREPFVIPFHEPCFFIHIALFTASALEDYLRSPALSSVASGALGAPLLPTHLHAPSASSSAAAAVSAAQLAHLSKSAATVSLDGATGNGAAFALHLFLASVWQDGNSRRILIFLCLNFSFMFVELSYGAWTNSLSLISDSGHMFLDCMGLVIGLYASYIARIRPNQQYTYGYGRFEYISGFINGIFLVFIAFSVSIEAIERFASPPDIHGDKLVLVAVLGFCINMIGLVFFHDHAHGAVGGGSAHGDGQACSHGHSHGGGNANMSAIYLHILADALGSVGVIVSSALIYLFGWMILDPICSLFISALILMSSWPLVASTARVLLQRVPPHLELPLKRTLLKV
jgi:zinc transporter 5/7